MCDFNNFGLIFVGQMHCLPQRLKSLKSTLFEIFSNGGCLKGTWSVEKISNNVDFSLWGNRATTWEYFLTFLSETKIMKIRHSEQQQLRRWRTYVVCINLERLRQERLQMMMITLRKKRTSNCRAVLLTRKKS